ncbi:MAG: glutathione peroxidase [Treponema sp.]|jgi:glutathione peroxidase|nr:glutathione peroxidase [Treponema sp.]
MNIYDFTVKDNKGEAVSLSVYRGKALLIVNTATRCGLTPQYEGLEALYKKYQSRGFEILDFPCNQFGGQTPEDDAGITEFCTINYGASFPRFAKIEVNGENTDPLFVWLKENAPEEEADEVSRAFEERIKAFSPFTSPDDIKWNFGKFLIDREGVIRIRYAPVAVPEKLEGDIESLL